MSSSRKRILVELLIAALLISSFSIIPQRASGELVTRIYDFKDQVNNEAFEGSDANQPPSSLGIGSGLSSTEYGAIANSDDAWAIFSNPSAPESDPPPAGDDSEYHRFRFRIFESASTITKLLISHEGYGLGQAYFDPNDPGVRLFIWNYGTSSWELFDENTASSDAVTTATILANFGDYVDSSGFLNVLVQAVENGSSCPFLYTFNGMRYTFVADLYNRGVLGVHNFRPQPEDYVKIENYQLQPVNGYYVLEVAQEYDEILYLDSVTLIAIDHAPNVDVFSSLLKSEADDGRIYTVSKSLTRPLSVVDESGSDVLQQILRADGVYTFPSQIGPKILEINLGTLNGADQIKLVLTGYTHWDNNRVVNTENPNARFVQVKDSNGNWVTVYENFALITPSALPRTYVLDLTGKFQTNDHTVRLVFYPDVRFDFIGVDTTPQQEISIMNLDTTYANLYFRGYSELRGIPALPNYYAVSPDAPVGYSYPLGRFTRFGDVLPLLADRDDEFVIMRHGDSISIQFTALPLDPELERDFLLYSVGYYKGRGFPMSGTVDPLPFQGMSRYPYPATEAYPFGLHMSYLNEYNTREYTDPGVPFLVPSHHTIYTDYVSVAVTFNRPPNPIGGEILTIDKITVWLPWLGMITVLVAVGTVALGLRKRPS